jgi:hypothetical protein
LSAAEDRLKLTSICMSLKTKRPPASRTTSQAMPRSSRLTLVVPVRR